MSVSFAKKALNYTLAIAKHAVDGFEKSSWEDYHKRIFACLSCQHKEENNGEYECGLCGCPIITKALWRSEDCPDPSGSRWEKEIKEPLPPFYQGNSGSSGGCGCNKN